MTIPTKPLDPPLAIGQAASESDNRVGVYTHQLKSWPCYFEDVLSGRKTFEIRVNDRGFQVGHHIELREYNPETEAFTGRVLTRRITYMGGAAVLPTGVVVLGIEPIVDDATPDELRRVITLLAEHFYKTRMEPGPTPLLHKDGIDRLYDAKPLGELLALADKHVCDIAAKRARWTMCIPAQWDDSDILLCGALRRAAEELAKRGWKP